MRQYSNEQRQRLALSILLAMHFEFILVDDMLEAGDRKFRQKMIAHFEEIRDEVTFFMATGNTRLVERLCQRAGVLQDGVVTLYDSVPQAIAAFNEINDGED
jgi:teichoic acid transport system ATP-binding protein